MTEKEQRDISRTRNSRLLTAVDYLMQRRGREMTLAEDMEKQGQPVCSLIEIWKDHSEAVLCSPSSSREDLQGETSKWVRRFDLLLEDCMALEADLVRLRGVLRELGKEPAVRKGLVDRRFL